MLSIMNTMKTIQDTKRPFQQSVLHFNELQYLILQFIEQANNHHASKC